MVFAVGVVVIDIGKGVIGAGVVPGLNLPFVDTDPNLVPGLADTLLCRGRSCRSCLADVAQLPRW